MKVNVTIEVTNYLLDYLMDNVVDNIKLDNFSTDNEIKDYIKGIIYDDFPEFKFVKEEICEEVLKRVRKRVSAN